MPAFTGLLAGQGIIGADAVRQLRGINGYARPWRESGDAVEKDKA